MTFYMSCCDTNCLGDCDCGKCMYFGGRDHGAVRCLADKDYRRKKSSREERRKNRGSKNKQRNP